MRTNAILTQIVGQATSIGRGEDDPTGGATLWEGRAACYLKSVRRRVISGGQQVTQHTDLLFIPVAASVPVVGHAGASWEGSVVTVEDHRGTAQTRTFKIAGMENRAVGSRVDSVRLELDTAAPVT